MSQWEDSESGSEIPEQNFQLKDPSTTLLKEIGSEFIQCFSSASMLLNKYGNEEEKIFVF